MMKPIEVCGRCGSSDLVLKETDYRSPFCQVLKCKECGTETLIPRREAAPNIIEPPHAAEVQEGQVRKDWRALA
jgi:uncharacterized Zn finger protein